MDPELATAIAAALGADVVGAARVHGGDVAVAFRVELADGRRVFAKTHRAPPPGFFSTEAAGLGWLAAAGAVDVPEVLAVSDAAPAVLVLSWIERGSARVTTDADLGRRLAALHRAGAPCFGREDRRTTGSRALPNEPAASWSRVLRLVAPAAVGSVGGRGGRAWRRRRSSGSTALAGRAGRRRWPARATGPAPRRPVGRQPPRRQPMAAAG